MRPLPVFLTLFGIGQLVLGALLWFAPGFFFDEVGPYGTRNDHYMGDLGTFYLTLGAVSLVAVRRTSWRVPVLAFALIQYVLHTVNHVLDLNESDPGWLGPANALSIGVTAVLLVWLLARARAEARA
jgi:hypothetical protein